MVVKNQLHITATVSTTSNKNLDNTNAIADSGTTWNLVPVGTNVKNIRTALVPIAVKLPAGEIIKSTQSELLPNKNILLGARESASFPRFEVCVSINRIIL